MKIVIKSANFGVFNFHFKNSACFFARFEGKRVVLVLSRVFRSTFDVRKRVRNGFWRVQKKRFSEFFRPQTNDRKINKYYSVNDVDIYIYIKNCRSFSCMRSFVYSSCPAAYMSDVRVLYGVSLIYSTNQTISALFGVRHFCFYANTTLCVIRSARTVVLSENILRFFFLFQNVLFKTLIFIFYRKTETL